MALLAAHHADGANFSSNFTPGEPTELPGVDPRQLLGGLVSQAGRNNASSQQGQLGLQHNDAKELSPLLLHELSFRADPPSDAHFCADGL